jgi:hypothetical protein
MLSVFFECGLQPGYIFGRILKFQSGEMDIKNQKKAPIDQQGRDTILQVSLDGNI